MPASTHLHPRHLLLDSKNLFPLSMAAFEALKAEQPSLPSLETQLTIPRGDPAPLLPCVLPATMGDKSRMGTHTDWPGQPGQMTYLPEGCM